MIDTAGIPIPRPAHDPTEAACATCGQPVAFGGTCHGVRYCGECGSPQSHTSEPDGENPRYCRPCDAEFMDLRLGYFGWPIPLANWTCDECSHEGDVCDEHARDAGFKRWSK